MSDEVKTETVVTPPVEQKKDDTAERLAALEKQNRELALYAAYKEQELEQALKKPAAKQEDPVDDDTPPETKALRGTVSDLQEQLDRIQFGNLAAQTGLTPEDVKATEEQLMLWRRSGMTIVDQTGAKRQPNRADAVRQVLGNKALAESQKAAPTRIQAQLRGMMGDVPGGAPAGQQAQNQVDPDKFIRMAPKDRIKLAEDALKDGF